VLSNHDVPRHRTRFGSEARARAAAVLLLTLRGTPFLYQGEELGLEDAEIPRERAVDPAGRDGCRAPIAWDASPGHGWGAAPWLPWPPEPERRNVETLRADPGSILHLYRRLLAARRASPALHRGACRFLDAPDRVLAYERSEGGDRRVVLVNSTGDEVPVVAAGMVEVASDERGEGETFRGILGADQAVVLRA
jgi:alpha-glucosidase